MDQMMKRPNAAATDFDCIAGRYGIATDTSRTVRAYGHSTACRMVMYGKLCALALMISFVAEAQEYGPVKADSVFCPDPEKFGPNQTVVYRVRLKAVLEMLEILVNKGQAPLSSVPDLTEIRVLESPTDSAVCQKLNEKFRDVLNQKTYIGGEYDAIYPMAQPIYFEYGESYFAYISYYVPEPSPGNMPLMSTGGASLLVIFDKNLNELFRSTD